MTKAIGDDEPFDTSTPPSLFAMSEVQISKARVEARRELRVRAERWGIAHGYEVAPSGLVQVVEGVEVKIAFSETAEMCTLSSSALHGEELELQVQPKHGRSWLAFLAGRSVETGDRDFDERWRAEANDESIATQLLDARVRAALISHPIWCRLQYTNGRIELHLDSGDDRLTGKHLILATEIVVALARAWAHATREPPPSPYR